MLVQYKITITNGLDARIKRPDSNSPPAYGFHITRFVRLAPHIILEDPFQGNWAHCVYGSPEDATAKAIERIEKDKARSAEKETA